MGDVTYFASKLLQEAIYPFNWAILCMLSVLVFLRRSKPKSAARLLAAGLALLLLPATGFVAEALIRPLETKYEAHRIEDYETADLIVVLGGTTAAVRPPRLEAEEPHGARIQTAVRLYRAGKAKTIVVSGGPYRVLGEVFRSEAADMRDVLVGLGVPQDAIIMEPNSRNTFENAAFTASLLAERSQKRVLLVTSALHLPRAVALFARQGVDVVPVPCSFLSGANFGIVSAIKPETVHIQHSESAIKEYVGRLVYWAFGRA